MKQLTRFWQDYGNGLLDTLEAFTKAARIERAAVDAPSTAAERFLSVYVDPPQFSAPERLRAPSLLTATSTLKQHERADWQNTHSDIMLFAAKMVEAFRRQGIPLYVHSAFRTKSEQDELFKNKRSNATYPRAPHCQGVAVDIVHSKYHWDMSPDEWKLVGKIGKQVAAQMMIPITWGGDFKSLYDPAHWELHDWKTNIFIPVLGEPVRLTPRGILAAY